MSRRTGIIVVIVVLIAVCGVGGALLLFSHSSSSPFPFSFGSFGTPSTNTFPFSQTSTTTNSQEPTQGQNSATKIFSISSGPVSGATFIETANPTSTVVRFVTQQDGHVFDFPLNTPGAAPSPISVVTIPGSQNVLWTQGGHAMLLQYIDNTQTIKTVYVKFSSNSGTSTVNGPAEVQFFPDNILDIVVSPDGDSSAYLLKNQSGGVKAYLAAADGSKPRLLFTFPLSDVLLSWPAQTLLLLQTKSAADVPGIAFEVGVKSGAVVPLLYGNGLTAIANKDFSEVLYQTRGGGSMNTYLHLLASGGDVPLYTPFPERCVWDALNSNILYCANPTSQIDANYLDSWHQGTNNISDNILMFEVSPSLSRAIATPGSADGGTPASIAQLAISPDDHYLLYITKGDRSLWGVRLTP